MRVTLRLKSRMLLKQWNFRICWDRSALPALTWLITRKPHLDRSTRRRFSPGKVRFTKFSFTKNHENSSPRVSLGLRLIVSVLDLGRVPEEPVFVEFVWVGGSLYPVLVLLGAGVQVLESEGLGQAGDQRVVAEEVWLRFTSSYGDLWSLGTEQTWWVQLGDCGLGFWSSRVVFLSVKCSRSISRLLY